MPATRGKPSQRAVGNARPHGSDGSARAVHAIKAQNGFQACSSLRASRSTIQMQNATTAQALAGNYNDEWTPTGAIRIEQIPNSHPDKMPGRLLEPIPAGFSWSWRSSLRANLQGA